MKHLLIFLILLSQQVHANPDQRLDVSAEAIVTKPDDKLFAQMNAGWPKSIESQLVDHEKKPLVQANKNYVFTFNYLPKDPLDLRSGELLHQSIQSKLLSKAEGGHMMIGWQCHTEKGFFKGMTAITGERKGQSSDLVQNGWGLNAYLAIYLDGTLQVPFHVDPDSKYDPESPRNLAEVIDRSVSKKRRDFAFILKEVSAQDCYDGLKFVSDFMQHRIDKDSSNYRFTSLADPLKFEGAGCISLGEAFMQKTKMFPGAIEDFSRNLAIDQRLLGYGEVDEKNRPVKSGELDKKVVIPDVQIQTTFVPQNPRRLSSFRLLNMNWDPEIPAFNPGTQQNQSEVENNIFRLKQVDPELVYLFFKEMSQAILNQMQQSKIEVSPILVNMVEQRRKISRPKSVNEMSTDSSYSNIEFKIDKDFDVSFPRDRTFAGTNSAKIFQRANEIVNNELNTYKRYLIPMYHSYGIVLVH